MPGGVLSHILLFVLFFFSGLTGLVYEVVWVRLFTEVFGNTTYAVTAVLAAFMAGLSLGAWIFGRFIDTRKEYLLIYTILESGIALCAASVPLAVPALSGLYSVLYKSFHFSEAALTAARFGISFALMLPSTMLMGGTLPVLGKSLVRRTGEIGRRTAALYGINTLGASLGCIITGFLLIKNLGARGSVFLAAAINLLIAALVFVMLRAGLLGPAGEEARAAPPGSAESDPMRARRRLLFLVLVGAAGFASLSYEILWTRLLVFKLKTTVYAFASMLSVYLLGIGAGSLLFPLIEKRMGIKDYWSLWGVLQAGIAAAGFCSLLSFAGIALLPIEAPTTGMGWTHKLLSGNLLHSLVVMGLPTLLMGLAFPVATAAYTRQVASYGRSVGILYACGTAGSILGSIATGFFLVSALGTQGSTEALVLLGGAVAAIALAFSPGTPAGKKRAPSADRTGRIKIIAAIAIILVLSAAVAALPRGHLLRYMNTGELAHDITAVIDDAHEGVEGITTVHHFADGGRVISTGSINVAGTAFTLRTTQKLQAHIPLLLHPKPRLVCQIGFGSGETSRIVCSYGIERLDLVEISRAVIDMADRHFRDINGGVTADPRFRAIIMDGANYLRLTGERYDIIMNDSIWPYYAGNSGLYTREYFEAAKGRLLPGGIMTSWVPVSMDYESLAVLLKTFHAVFPRVSLWFATSHENQHALIVGSSETVAINPLRFRERFARLAKPDLAEIGYGTPAAFLDIYKFDEEAIAEMEWAGAYHTVDRPYLEFAESRTTMHDLSNGLMMIRLYRKDAARLPGVAADAGLRAGLALLYEATGHVLNGLVLRAGADASYRGEYIKALSLVPDYPGISSARDEGKTPSEEQSKGIPEFNRAILEAKGLLGEGRFMEMLPVLERAIRLDPRSGEAYTLRGEAFLKMGRFGDAMEHLKKAIELSPERFEAYYHLGWIYFRMGDLDAATAQFEKGIDRNPKAAELHYLLGKALAYKNRPREARRSFQRAAALSPFDAEFYYELGAIDEREGNTESAIRSYEKAIKLNPQHVDAKRRIEFLRARSMR